ncbi:MAG TPA: cupin domain-containing protein [Actinophytocola sp.]|uniref:cupin domain-containing protein n=1 Tax=Actinophytocola sp. TaxID=1872138 RepID=UPI002DBB22BF|nr:cupin domain-containing protein [Actinophytocola sp.]HEU5472346.1 cupin domain-containing protein [Actinophytocola sp.]
MSYPDPRYFGDTGEIDTRFRPDGEPPAITYPTGGTVDYLAGGASTDGQFGLYRWNFGAQESGPGPHFHRTITESFYILSGTVRLYNGEEWIKATAGDFLYVPQGGIHGFRNVPGEPASMLLLFTPGAPREDYFETLAEIARGRQLTHEESAEFFLRHDNHWV